VDILIYVGETTWWFKSSTNWNEVSVKDNVIQ